MLRRSPALIVAVSLAAFAGIGLRIVSLRGDLGASDSDEAIWALMTRTVVEGEFPVYFWGQGYGGAVEVYLGAPIMWALGGGLGGARVLAAVLGIVATCLVFVVGRRALDPQRAIVAAALFWMWPAYAVWKSTRVNGFYLSGQILGLLVILIVLRLAERPRYRDAMAFGFVAGLAVWQTLQVIPVLLPALAWLAWRRRDAFRLAWLAIPGLVLGALPAVVVNVRNGWWFNWQAPGGGTYTSRLQGFFSAALSQALGVRVPFSLDWLVPSPIGLLVVAGAVAGTAILLARHRTGDVGLLATVALGFPFIYALSPYTWFVAEPRYLVVLAPVIVLLIVVPLQRSSIAAAALTGAAVLSLVGLMAIGRGDSFERRYTTVAMPTDLDPIIAALDERRITRAISEYWLTYRVIFETRERILLGNDSDDHYPKYRDAVARAGREIPHVYLAGSADERRARERLRQQGYRREEFGGFALWTRP